MDIREKFDSIIIGLTNGILTELELNDNTDLVIDAFFDSITIIQCVVEIETEFEIEFEDEFLLTENLKNYKWLLEYIRKKVCEKELESINEKTNS